MPCTVTTHCSLCGQRMSGEYPPKLTDAIAALVREHNKLRECHRELEEQEEAEVTWKSRHDTIVDQRNALKEEMLKMKAEGMMKPAELKVEVLNRLTTEELLETLARRVK